MIHQTWKMFPWILRIKHGIFIAARVVRYKLYNLLRWGYMLTRYPLVNLQRAIENGPVEIVDLPIKMVDLSIVM
jgi:hypothetical protein